MMKIILIISFLVSPIFSEEESELNKFEESLKEEKINSSDTNSNTNESQSNHTTQNLNNRNCSHSYCYNYCTHSYKKKERKSSLSERIESFFEFSKILARIIEITVKPIITVIYSPIWGPLEMDEYSDGRLSFDKYPFYSTNGMFKENGRDKYVKAEFSSLSFNNSIYGNKAKINFQYFGKTGFNYSYFHLKENMGSLSINKYMNNFMFHRNFSINNNFLQKHSIDFSYGIGYSNWISSEYEDSGVKIEYGIRSFIKPFSLNFKIGYADIGNGMFDVSADISYHYKRYSFNFGLQQFETNNTKIGGKTYSISYWF